MTEFQATAFAYGIILLLLGLPLVWAIMAMCRQFRAGNISRDLGAASKRNLAGRRSFLSGLLVAILFGAKGAFSRNQNLIGLVLLIAAGGLLLQLYRARLRSAA